MSAAEASVPAGHVPVPVAVWCDAESMDGLKRRGLRLVGDTTEGAEVVLLAVQRLEGKVDEVAGSVAEVRDAITGDVHGSPGLNGRVSAIEERLDTMERRSLALDVRTTSLERWWFKVLGGAATIGFILSMSLALAKLIL